jgi:uncharacterized membrane protein
MSLLQILEIMAVVLAGLLVGNELAIAAFVHPILYRLEDREHRAAASPIAKSLGRVMPPWYALVLVLIATEAWIRRANGRSAWLLILAAVLWVGTILFSIVMLVPINTRVASWTAEKYSENWRDDRRRWDSLHRVRVVVLTVALICLVAGLI